MYEFTFKVSQEEQKYTRRGLLSIINSVFMPVVIRGTLLWYEMIFVTTNTGKNESLPVFLQDEWSPWVN